ncbi:hypothetical protein PDJAM_G00002590 [Pangasius djambal]|uniref:Uncharacterized protein n=1 Tax=Pangasius djambal TaxID=1691987 RepID=A0ACC5XY40_9TELE|nr:hypothetical protein [Pangasius djambal]
MCCSVFPIFLQFWPLRWMMPTIMTTHFIMTTSQCGLAVWSLLLCSSSWGSLLLSAENAVAEEARPLKARGI